MATAAAAVSGVLVIYVIQVVYYLIFDFIFLWLVRSVSESHCTCLDGWCCWLYDEGFLAIFSLVTSMIGVLKDEIDLAGTDPTVLIQLLD
jgi:hypothetical protein